MKKDAPEEGCWLNRNIFGMELSSFFCDAGHEMATAVLPLFLISIGAPAFALGIIEGISDAVSSFVKLGAGWFSDRAGRRKPIAVSGNFLTGLTTGLFAFVSSWPQVLLVRSAGWLGRGIRGHVRDAMLADSVMPKAGGRAFGREESKSCSMARLELDKQINIATSPNITALLCTHTSR